MARGVQRYKTMRTIKLQDGGFLRDWGHDENGKRIASLWKVQIFAKLSNYKEPQYVGEYAEYYKDGLYGKLSS